MRAIDADALNSIKFHSLPYTHITPSDADAESYKRGWNDAIDSIIENAPTIEPQRKKGHWIRHPEQRNIFNGKTIECSECHEKYTVQYVEDELFCRHCGADMREDGEANEGD